MRRSAGTACRVLYFSERLGAGWVGGFWGGVVRGAEVELGLLGGLRIAGLAWGLRAPLIKLGDAEVAGVGLAG